MVQRKSRLGSTGFAGHLGGTIAKSGIGMDLLHQGGKVVGRIDLPDCLVE